METYGTIAQVVLEGKKTAYLNRKRSLLCIIQAINDDLGATTSEKYVVVHINDNGSNLKHARENRGEWIRAAAGRGEQGRRCCPRKLDGTATATTTMLSHPCCRRTASLQAPWTLLGKSQFFLLRLHHPSLLPVNSIPAFHTCIES